MIMWDIRTSRLETLSKNDHVLSRFDLSSFYAALKEKIENDLDEISKIAQGLKGKLEALDRAV